MRLLLPVGVTLLAALPAQGVQLSTANVNPVAHANSAHIYSLEFYVPFGTLVLPIIIGNPLQGVSMELRGTATDLSVRSRGTATWTPSGRIQTNSDLVTTIATPLPARVSIVVDRTLSYMQMQTTVLPTANYRVDVGNDASDEFVDKSLAPNSEAGFPPFPGLVFYARTIAVRGGAFVGTNAVIIRT